MVHSSQMHIATNSEIIDISLEVKTAELAKKFSKLLKKGEFFSKLHKKREMFSKVVEIFIRRYKYFQIIFFSKKVKTIDGQAYEH